MAELSSQDVVNHSQSVGDASPSDVPATTSQSKSTLGDEGEGVVVRENGFHPVNQLAVQEEQALEDGTTRSDTDTSRADGDAKSTDARPVRKAVTAKPVSFAKYNVPKVIAANAAKSQVEKGTRSISSLQYIRVNFLKAPLSANPVQPTQLVGRPRLVAKTVGSLSQKVQPFKTASPDPMQVWNKNRITPQPSTKNLTDEELKQKYGIHLTSRLQTDVDDKEAKWADIDEDDEDDWAPETIEWGDGTKTTVNPADSTPATKSAATSKPSTPAIEAPKSATEAKPATSFSTSIGPNAKVLKIGARAETQQAQKATQQTKGSSERPTLTSTPSNPAPVPSKSPWAKLPPVEKASPVEVNAQPAQPARTPGQLPGPSSGAIPPPQISADDFNRNWRDSTQPQLFMPNSGRYEAVPENRRRMSRNEGFRAPAVLQRPGQNDPSAPEPSAAFQTNRTSSDVMRRRASSTLSGDAAQVIRRMSIKSGEAPLSTSESAVVEESEVELKPISSQVNTPAYQARGGGDYVAGPGQTDAELEAQRAQQRRLMKEQAELARKRRLEEEQRQEAERKERIRQKLLSLGPDPKALKAEQEAKAKVEAEAKAREEAEKAEKVAKETKEAPVPTSVPETAVASPPKPPQPNATGEPQQYGMMKVHALDSVKKTTSPTSQQAQAKPLSAVQSLQPTIEEISPEPPVATVNGEASRIPPESSPIPEPIPRSNRPVAEARARWGHNDHRSPPTSNLWGAPHNKALGNGTFDQTLAGYAPQDLSSRASSTGQGWMNGRTPTVGQSPQLSHINHHVPETRSQALQNMTSPEPLPLAMNSEADSMLPVRPPAPIGPPQAQPHPVQHSPMMNGYAASPQNTSSALAGWNNFQNVARVQERAEHDQYQRELAAKREEEKRSGVRPQANYNFDETFKQVQLGAQPDQRQVNSVAQTNLPPSSLFGAVGSMPPSAIGTPGNRGSRFFPQQAQNGVPTQRAVTYSHIQVPRSPSPPPAEESGSSHPAYGFSSQMPVIRLPPAKAVVKLPPAKSLTPPTTAPISTPTPTAATEPVQPAMPTQPSQPMTWAARAAMPPPKPAATLRAASQAIVNNPSWQERFNGLLAGSNRKSSDTNQAPQTMQGLSAHPAMAVTSATKEPLDVMPAVSASVSLPQSASTPSTPILIANTEFTTRDVEDEEDLFEDREAGSLPTLYFPTDAPAITWPRAIPGRIVPTPPEVQSAFIYLGSQWKEERYPKQQFAIVRAPGSEKSIKKDLPLKTTPTVTTNGNHNGNHTGNHRPPPRHNGGPPIRRGYRGGRSRPAPTKA